MHSPIPVSRIGGLKLWPTSKRREGRRGERISAGASGGPAPCRKIAPSGQLHEKAYYLSFVCIYSVGTFVFDANNHEAN